MGTATPPALRGLGRTPPHIRTALLIGLVFVIALLPRVLDSARFITTDEFGQWLGRSQRFLAALRSGELQNTRQTPYPGVTTMWLGALGWLAIEARAAASGPVSFADSMALLRLPIGVASALAVAAGYAVLRRLVDGRLALLAALLWAADPFLVAHARVLHVDSVLSWLMTLAFLTALLAFRTDAGAAGRDRPPRWAPLLISGALAGMAVLTKLPGLFVAPAVGLVAVASGWGSRRRARALPLGPLLAWGAVALLTWLALYPAAWVDPIGTLRSLREAAELGAAPHENGNFFLGRIVEDPGPIFYPVAIGLRLTPWGLLGLLAGLAALALGRLTPERRRLALWAGLYALTYLGAMTLGGKKFDRYALPAFPALTIIAAAGLLWAGSLLAARLRLRRSTPLAWAVAIAGMAANLGWYHPYYLAYYNPLLGGGPVAARTLLVGWGEGLELAGDYLRGRANGCLRPVIAWADFLLEPHLCSTLTTNPARAGYSVFYISQLQRGIGSADFAALSQARPPDYVARVHGIAYAYVFELPPPAGQPLAARFGSGLQLRGYELQAGDADQAGALQLKLHWQSLAPIGRDYSLFVHVFDPAGQILAQVDLPLGGAGRPSGGWREEEYVTTEQPLPLPAGLAPGRYWLSIGVYDPGSLGRLPLDGPAPPAGAPDDGQGALVLPALDLP